MLLYYLFLKIGVIQAHSHDLILEGVFFFRTVLSLKFGIKTYFINKKVILTSISDNLGATSALLKPDLVIKLYITHTHQ